MLCYLKNGRRRDSACRLAAVNRLSTCTFVNDQCAQMPMMEYGGWRCPGGKAQLSMSRLEKEALTSTNTHNHKYSDRS